MKKSVIPNFVLCLILSVSMLALAQERNFLQKTEVEALATGKKWNHVRLKDRDKIVWDLHNGGELKARNSTTKQSDAGTWSVNEEGQLCVKWRGKSQNRCVAILKDGKKLLMVDSKNLKSAYAELMVE